MKVYDADDNALITGFTSTKQQILMILKQKGEIDLPTLAKELDITKMGVLNHINSLEEMEVVERFSKNIGVGRPRTAFRLASNAHDIFPKAYSSVTCSVLEFIEENMGRRAVYQALKKRQNDVKQQYSDQLQNREFAEKISEFARLRDQDGYMVELNMVPNSDGFELLEFNCPILNIADKYQEACTVEGELFADLFDAEVNTTHRTIDGDHVCRFFIKPKSK